MKKKKKREKNRAVKPDEVFSFGPLQFSRFGNRILSKNRMSEAQHAEMTRKIASSLDEVVLGIICKTTPHGTIRISPVT